MFVPMPITKEQRRMRINPSEVCGIISEQANMLMRAMSVKILPAMIKCKYLNLLLI